MYKIKKKRLRKFIDLLKAIDDEHRIELKEDCWNVKSVDPAHVAMIDIDITQDAFEEFESRDEVRALNINILDNFLGYYKKDDIIELDFKEKVEKVDRSGAFEDPDYKKVDVGYITLRGEIIDGFYHNTRHRLLDTAGMSSPSVPDLDLKVQFEIPNRILQVITDYTNDIGIDHTRIRIENERVIFEGQDGDKRTDISSTDVELESEERDISLESVYANDYLKDLVDVFAKEQTLTLSLQEDYPAEISFEDDGIEGFFLLAPRIETG